MSFEALQLEIDGKSLLATNIAECLLVLLYCLSLFSQLGKLIDNRAWENLEHDLLGEDDVYHLRKEAKIELQSDITTHHLGRSAVEPRTTFQTLVNEQEQALEEYLTGRTVVRPWELDVDIECKQIVEQNEQ